MGNVQMPLWVFGVCMAASAQPRYDLLLKGGHVLDAKNGINAVRDVAIANGRIAAVAQNIPAAEARRTVDVKNLYVTPGLVDMHVHVFAATMDREYTGEFGVRPRRVYLSQRRGPRSSMRAAQAGVILKISNVS